MDKKRQYNTTTIWYAACQTDHFFWAGPDRDKYENAKEDAEEHDKEKHSGVSTAVVLSV